MNEIDILGRTGHSRNRKGCAAGHSPMAEKYVGDLVNAFPAIEEVWLIGSRANDSARDDSDWDLLVFADEAVLSGLKKDASFCHADMDLLVVYNGENFEAPWGTKSGSLKAWNWSKVSPTIARYKGTKWLGEEADPSEWAKTSRAVRIWPPLDAR